MADKKELIQWIEGLSEAECLDFVWGLRNLMADFKSDDETDEDKDHRLKIIKTCNEILNNE